MDFKGYINLNEGLIGYTLANLYSILEGRRNPEALQGKKEKLNQGRLFKTAPKEIARSSCPNTPLSGYQKHISAIQSFSQASPDNFAQVLMFSPLSANVSFAKHWDNFQTIMFILKHYFPQQVDRQKFEMVVDAFGDYLHSLPMTINGFKLDTVTEIWNNREQLMNDLNALAKEGDDDKIIARLSQIKGVQPVKAGFIAQLLYGKAGCIDTHNIDIYTKVFPDMADQFKDKEWNQTPEGIKKYTDLLKNLEKRGIGSQQLWDVWVDFVENMYKMISSHGKGYYADAGSALNPDDPAYDALKDIKIPKRGIGRNKRDAFVPLVSGKHGMGASSTHLQMDPDDALNNFYNMFRMGKKGSEAASSVPFHTDKLGRPLDPTAGLGVEPTLLKYFGQSLTPSGEVDPDVARHIINQRLKYGGKKAWKSRADASQNKLF